MKTEQIFKYLLILIILLLPAGLSAQFDGFHYKALITENGNVLANHDVTIRFTIIKQDPVYTETVDATTDENGIVSTIIGHCDDDGSGTYTDEFCNIDWRGPTFLKVEIDAGNGFMDYGTNPFYYVPYAKLANKVLHVSYDELEGKPVTFYKEGTTDEPEDISNDIYHLGEIRIGKDTALGGQMSIYSDNKLYGIKIVKDTHKSTAISNTLAGDGDGVQRGVHNIITNTGDNEHTAVFNELQDAGFGEHMGIYNLFEGAGLGYSKGLYNEFFNANSGKRYGVYNVFGGDKDGNMVGVLNDERNTGVGDIYGIYNTFSGNNHGDMYGMLNTMRGSNGNYVFGVKTEITNDGIGFQVGSFNILSGNGIGKHEGTHNYLSGSGPGDKYGTFNLIDSAAGGTHYAVYGKALKSGSYAGFFEGDVKVNSHILSVIPPGNLNDNGALNMGNSGLLVGSTSSGIGIDVNQIECIGSDLYINYVSKSNVSLAAGGGSVGVGTWSPGDKLQVGNGSGDNAIKVYSESGHKSTLKLFELGDYGFELQYDGNSDELNLWSKKFTGNEAIRTKWHKNGNVEINGKVTADRSGDSDMKAYAYGSVTINGDFMTKSDNVSVERTSTGTFQVTLDGDTYSLYGFVTIASICETSLGLVRTNDYGGKLLIKTYDIDGNLHDYAFSFVVYKK